MDGAMTENIRIEKKFPSLPQITWGKTKTRLQKAIYRRYSNRVIDLRSTNNSDGSKISRRSRLCKIAAAEQLWPRKRDYLREAEVGKN